MDSFTAALARLDPANRALLDLSLRRGMRPDAIAELLGIESTSVVAAREGALDQLSEELGVSDRDVLRARLAELPPAAWTHHVEEKPRRRRGRLLPVLLSLLALALIALVIALASRSDEKTTAKSPPASTPVTETTPAPAPGTESEPGTHKARPTRLTDVGGSGAQGTAVLARGGKRLVLKASGLPNGGYQVWLYNSVLDARALGGSRGTALNLNLRLPGRASHYKAIDVSREPRDGNPNHSGQSVLRVRLAKLAGG